jgi:hypothetical protein
MNFHNEESRDNSVAAFKQADHETNQDKVVKLFMDHRQGLIADDLIASGRFDPAGNSPRAAMNALKKKGLIVPLREGGKKDGKVVKRLTRSKRPAVVYVWAAYYPDLPPDTKPLRSGTYAKPPYDDPHWQDLRERKMIETRSRDEITGVEVASYELHHRHYDTVGHESTDDVMLLSPRMHKVIEHKYKQRDGSLEADLKALFDEANEFTRRETLRSVGIQAP